MKISIEPQYFATVTFFTHLIHETNELFFICEDFRKMTFRNRCTIAGANGAINLSVPIVGGRDQHTSMNEIKIDNRQKWKSQHWKSICSCYNHSPWFEFYRDSLKELIDQPFELLIDLDLASFKWVHSQLGFSVLSLELLQNRQEADLDLVDRFTPRSLRTESPLIRYRQLFEERTGFIPHLSILDLLFCTGKNSLDLIKAQASSSRSLKG